MLQNEDFYTEGEFKMRAVIYARFSSDNQREESIDAQVRAAEEYAKRNGLHIVKLYADRAKTATSDKRPEFQKMIKDSAANLFDVVIVHKLDRFSRDKYDSAKYKRQLKINGIKLLSVTENLDGSPESVILESLLEGMAEYYSKNLAREVMKGMKENALKCQHTGGLPPLGYDVDKTTKKYIINEAEAETVRKIYDMYLGGFGYDRIITQLNEDGRVTKKGRTFGKNSLHDILVNEKYAGVYVFNRSTSKGANGMRNTHTSKSEDEIIRIPGGVPQIIDQEIFYKVQEKMCKNRHQPGAYKAKEVYLLSGLIMCGECLEREGKAYSMMGNAKYSGRNKRKHVTYRCSNRERTKQCDNKEIRREYIETLVLSELEKNIFNDKAIPHLVKKLNEFQKSVIDGRSQDIKQLQAAVTDVTKRIDNIIDAISSGYGGSVLTKKLGELEEEKALAETAIQEYLLKQQSVTLVTEDMLRGLFAKFRQFVAEKNILEVRKFIGNYVKQVIVYKDHVEVVFFLLFGNQDVKEGYQFLIEIDRYNLLRKFGKVA
jgi:site-specific DNA recombinase